MNMPVNLSTILVFRTDKEASDYSSQVSQVMESFGDRLSWNLDLDDVDKVLRIETETVTPEEIIHTMKVAGFECSELED